MSINHMKLLMKAIYTSILALALSTSALQAHASILTASNDFQAAAPGWIYASGSSKIVSAEKDPSNKVLQFTGNHNEAVKFGFAKQGDDMFVSFDFSYTGTMTRNTFIGVSFGGQVSSPSIGIKANCDDASGVCKNDVFVRMSDKTTVMMAGSDLAPKTNYTIFGRLYKEKGSTTYNRFDAWLDPTTAELQSLMGWNASATGKTTLSSVDTLGIRTAFLDGKSTLQIDNLEVSQVPEPGILSLFGLALAGVALSRRKRA